MAKKKANRNKNATRRISQNLGTMYRGLSAEERLGGGDLDLYNAKYKKSNEMVLTDNGVGMSPEELKRAVSGEMSDEELSRLSPAMMQARQMLLDGAQLRETHSQEETIQRMVDALAEGGTINPVDGKSKAMVAEARRRLNAQKKRKPLLYDVVVNEHKFIDTIVPIKQQKIRQDRLRDARVFAFDESAARYAADLIREYPAAIARDQQFAIPPYANMYIELPYKAFFSALNYAPFDDETGDETVGYHYDGPRVYVYSRMPNNKQMWGPHVQPYAFRLNQPFEPKEEARYMELMRRSRHDIDEFLWGSSWEHVYQMPEARMLRANHSFYWWFAKTPEDMRTWEHEERFLYHMARSAAGDLRNIIAFLLFLNRTSDIRYDDFVPAHRAMIRNKPSVLTKHSIVRLRLDPGPTLKRLYGGPLGPIWRREHEVRGHFCHDKLARANDHEHDWHEYGVNHWRCLKCGGAKWWRKECIRWKGNDHGRPKTSYEVVP